MSKYDEDLNENSFFQFVLQHLNSFDDVVVILVPQKSSLPSRFDLDDMKSHVVVEKSPDLLQSLNGGDVEIKDAMVTLNGGLEVPILFNETHYYGQDWEKVKILCIQRPLTEPSFEFQGGVVESKNVEECKVDVLDVQNALKVLEKNCTDSEKICKRLETTAKTIIHALPTSGENNPDLKKTFAQALLPMKSIKKKPLLSQACEMYFFHVIYNDLFPYICAKNQVKDCHLNQKILIKTSTYSTDPSRFPALAEGAKANLKLMSSLSSPKSKLDSLDQLLKLPSLDSSNGPLSSDDLLPWLIQALSTCQIFNLYSQLDFMTNYHLEVGFKLTQKDLFNLATFEAALEHLSTTIEDIQDIKTTHEDLDRLFKAISMNDLSKVERLLDQEKGQHHPLCDCEQCTADSGILTCKDDHFLWTPLALASWLGHPMIVEYLIKPNFKAGIEDKDKYGRTALHLAACNGHQNALLLLLNNAKADINAKDNLNNTPLHYSAGHGHESCTKALLYSAESSTSLKLDISAANYRGETPLHWAAKHGFLDMVTLLLDHGAQLGLRNHSGETPMDVAHNIAIKLKLSP